MSIQATNRPKVSLIVPVFNVKPYLNECIDSLIHQTYQNIEIILIDDGSTDGSEIICDQYKDKDSRVVVIHNTNGGLSYSRNCGLDICTGEYVSFVDSDDYLSHYFVEVLVDIVIRNGLTICFACNKPFVSNNPSADTKINDDIEVIQHSGKECLDDLLGKSRFCGTRVTGGLLSKKCFSEKKFKIGVLHEDTELVSSLFGNAEMIGFINVSLYFRRVRDGSLTSSSLSTKNLDLIDAYKSAEKYCMSNYPEFTYLARNRIVSSALTLLIKYYAGGMVIDGFEKKCKAALKEYIGEKNIEARYKVIYGMIVIAPYITANLICHLYKL